MNFDLDTWRADLPWSVWISLKVKLWV